MCGWSCGGRCGRLTSCKRCAPGASPAQTLGLGPSGATGALIKYTFAGDASLDGKVDLTDFTVLAANFNATTKLWYQGDFNYDQKVDLTDFTLLASNFNQTMSATTADPTTLAATVPEPTACAWLLLTALTLATNSTRQSRRDRRWP